MKIIVSILFSLLFVVSTIEAQQKKVKQIDSYSKGRLIGSEVYDFNGNLVWQNRCPSNYEHLFNNYDYTGYSYYYIYSDSDTTIKYDLYSRDDIYFYGTEITHIVSRNDSVITSNYWNSTHGVVNEINYKTIVRINNATYYYDSSELEEIIYTVNDLATLNSIIETNKNGNINYLIIFQKIINKDTLNINLYPESFNSFKNKNEGISIRVQLRNGNSYLIASEFFLVDSTKSIYDQCFDIINKVLEKGNTLNYYFCNYYKYYKNGLLKQDIELTESRVTGKTKYYYYCGLLRKEIAFSTDNKLWYKLNYKYTFYKKE